MMVLRSAILVALLLGAGCAQRPQVIFGADGCDVVPIQKFDGGYTQVGLRRTYTEDLHPLAALAPFPVVELKLPTAAQTYLVSLQSGEGADSICEPKTDRL